MQQNFDFSKNQKGEAIMLMSLLHYFFNVGTYELKMLRSFTTWKGMYE
uniref:Uncharacterized protein n=1 Tax=Arundo donax TaxID=35708 RepID=A0A0A8Z047_ARUDO